MDLWVLSPSLSVSYFSIHTCFSSLPSFWICRSCLSVNHQPPGIVVHACNPRILEVEIGGLLWVWGRMSYTVSTRPVRYWDAGLFRPCLKTIVTTKTCKIRQKQPAAVFSIWTLFSCPRLIYRAGKDRDLQPMTFEYVPDPLLSPIYTIRIHRYLGPAWYWSGVRNVFFSSPSPDRMHTQRTQTSAYIKKVFTTSTVARWSSRQRGESLRQYQCTLF